MTVLVVGSVALDSVETPFGKADDVLGGSATFFSASASHFTPVQVVGVVGSDYPVAKLEPLTKRGDMSVMLQSVLGVEALVMMVELAAHVGVDLWSYEMRGVSVMTGALYPMYYFYVTERWTWEEITPEEVQAIFRAHGGYLEIVNKRYTPRDIKPLLEDLRPLVDPLAGGMPTLTHGVAARRGLFG